MKSAVKLLDWEHFPCIAHTLNLIVKAGLDVIQNSLIKKIKAIVQHFHRSPQATQQLISIQEQFKPEI